MTRKVEIAHLSAAVGSFVRDLKRENLSPNTIATYETALRQLSEFLAAHGLWIAEPDIHHADAT